MLRPGGHSHMSVDIKSLSIDSLFYADPASNDPLFSISPHPMTNFFPTFVSNFTYKLQIFACFSRILRNLAILWQFWYKTSKFWLEIAFLHTEWPPFLGVHTKKDPILFWVSTLNDSPFSTKSYTERPLFLFFGRHLYVTFIFECPPGVRGYFL